MAWTRKFVKGFGIGVDRPSRAVYFTDVWICPSKRSDVTVDISEFSTRLQILVT